jgi:membrane-bound ClpP family serine protease
MSVLGRYWLYQVPGAALAALVVAGLWYVEVVSARVATGIWLAWLVKDVVVYPLVRAAYERAGTTGAERLVGRHGVARERLDPAGWVHVRGELWRAEAADRPIPPGSRVRVHAARGSTLIVAADEDE